MAGTPLLVAVTGPPFSGKTTLVRRLAGDDVHVVEETAIVVIRALNEELGSVDAQRAWRLAHPVEFQLRLALEQGRKEREAEALDVPLVLFDRTSIDGVAYLLRAGNEVPAAIEELASAVRLDLVLDLELLEAAFEVRRATGRQSSIDDAREIARFVSQVYRDHGFEPVALSASVGVEERAELARDLIQELLRDRGARDQPGS